MALQPGDMAPDFTLPSTVGDKITLSDYRGKKNVLLLFYPLDFSPVCSGETKECAQMMPTGSTPDVEVIGISVDSLWTHKAFAAAQGIAYPLVADFHPKGAVAEEVRRLPRRQGHLGAHGLHHRQGRQDQGDRRRRHPGRARHRRDPRESPGRVGRKPRQTADPRTTA